MLVDNASDGRLGRAGGAELPGRAGAAAAHERGVRGGGQRRHPRRAPARRRPASTTTRGCDPGFLHGDHRALHRRAGGEDVAAVTGRVLLAGRYRPAPDRTQPGGGTGRPRRPALGAGGGRRTRRPPAQLHRRPDDALGERPGPGLAGPGGRHRPARRTSSASTAGVPPCAARPWTRSGSSTSACSCTSRTPSCPGACAGRAGASSTRTTPCTEHQHAASSGTGTAFFRLHNTRNRLVVTAAQAPWPVVGRAVVRTVWRLVAGPGRGTTARALWGSRAPAPYRPAPATVHRPDGSVPRSDVARGSCLTEPAQNCHSQPLPCNPGGANTSVPDVTGESSTIVPVYSLPGWRAVAGQPARLAEAAQGSLGGQVEPHGPVGLEDGEVVGRHRPGAAEEAQVAGGHAHLHTQVVPVRRSRPLVRARLVQDHGVDGEDDLRSSVGALR